VLLQLDDLAVCIEFGGSLKLVVSIKSYFALLGTKPLNQPDGCEQQKVLLCALPVLGMNAAGAPLLQS